MASIEEEDEVVVEIEPPQPKRKKIATLKVRDIVIGAGRPVSQSDANDSTEVKPTASVAKYKWIQFSSIPYAIDHKINIVYMACMCVFILP